MRRMFGVSVCVVCAMVMLRAQVPDMPSTAGKRIVVWGGLGVAYVHPSDILTLVNTTYGAIDRAPSFTSGAEFTGALSVPVLDRWSAKFEYTFLLISYTLSSSISASPAMYTVHGHLPMLVVQYTLVDNPFYCLKLGCGVGYYAGSVHTDFFTLNDTYSANGISGKIELEGITAVSENLFVLIGGELRWMAGGALVNASGTGPLTGEKITLSMFAPAARIGVAYLP